MSGPPEDPFTDDVVEAIVRHMNNDHADAALVICQALGGVPDATRATTTAVDAEGIDFAADVGASQVPVRIPWARRLVERAEVRTEVVRIYQEACMRAGIPAQAEKID